MPVKVLYITGLGHSGSTLLSRVLNAHSRIVSLGEIKTLPRKWRNLSRSGAAMSRPARCTCGVALQFCEFWSRVSDRVERTTKKSLPDLDLKGRNKQVFIEDNVALFEAVHHITQGDVIVDASKDLRRLEWLLQVETVEVIPVYLARDAKAQICSVRTRRDRVRDGKKGHLLIRDIFNYVKKVRSLRSFLSGVPHIRVDYETFASDPKGVATVILDRLSLPFESQQISWGDYPGHLVGGNRMRWEGSSEIRKDERWKTLLSPLEKIAIDLGTLPARYGLPKDKII